MPRWDTEAEERLRTAAIELFLELGYENVTVAQIADRAGLTRRTFSRYFADKRDVLFAGSDRLPELLANAVSRADPELTPFEAILAALIDFGSMLASQVAGRAAQRREVIARSPELQERGRTKFAAVALALATGLVSRGTEPASAALLGDVGVAVFRTGFDRWVDDPDGNDLPTCLRDVGAELAASIAPGRDPHRHDPSRRQNPELLVK
jgi:AcrR family transcriptional regulator